MSMGYDLKNIYELTNCNIRPSTPLSKQSIIKFLSLLDIKSICSNEAKSFLISEILIFFGWIVSCFNFKKIIFSQNI